MRFKRALGLIWILGACLQASIAHAQTMDAFHELREKVETATLSNGIRVVVIRRPHAPIFSGQIWIKVGGVDEPRGKTGVAHLLEHMAFKGSETIGTKDFAKEKPLLDELERLLAVESPDENEKSRIDSLYQQIRELWVDNEFSKIYEAQGAVGLNAGTSKDYTFYMVSLPVNAFELWCWMESDRLLNPVFRQFFEEREVVLEERRMSIENSPTGKLYESLLATAYTMHPYRFPTLGWRSDVSKLQPSDLRALYSAFYQPDNMVIALAGDVELESVLPMLEKYFGRIKEKKGKPPEVRTEEAPQEAPKEATVYFDAEPEFMISYHKPTFPYRDDAQFALLHSLLSDGRSSILYKELVLEKKLASSIYTTEAPGERFPSVFIVGGTPRSGVTTDQLRKEIEGIFERLSETPPSDELFDAAMRRLKVSVLQSLDSNYELSKIIARADVLWGDWEVVFDVYSQMMATTPEDVSKLVKKYLQKENQTFVSLVRE